MANNYKQTVTGTIGAGFKSVFSGSGRKYYILEHKVGSKYHRAGESQEIIVDQIELGRDARCQVRYDDSFATVSRRHAAIVRDGDNWKLVQLSTTNKTFLNGAPVDREWYLQNGDEIQLSVNGPKLGFIIPQGNKSTVNTIGLSRRFSLFRQQALRPYKTAVTILSIVLLLAIAAGTFFILRGNNVNKELREKMVTDSITAQENLAKMSGKMDSLSIQLKQLRKTGNKIKKDDKIIIEDQVNRPYKDYIYYIQTISYTVEMDGEEEVYEVGDEVQLDEDGSTVVASGWSGTGFLLSNGKLVTARHCIEGWYYNLGSSDWNLLLNLLASQGAKVCANFVAIAPNGNQITFSSNDVMCRRSGDHPFTFNGNCLTLAGNTTFDPLDYAWYDTGKSSGLNFDAALSENLTTKTKLEIYGYPHRWGVKSARDVTPILGSGVVSRDGLENGIILVGEASYESGHSGSPAFYVDENGNYTVVGIVTAISDKFGFIVPISVIK